MKVGIGIPNTTPGSIGDSILEWARKADGGPFSSLGTIGRVVYDNFEELIALSACAGATQRIRLMTTILVAPARNPVILAKQAASLNGMSGGRFTLGLGIGPRPDDLAAVGESFRRRGKRFDEQLRVMKRIWSDEPLSSDVGPIGPSRDRVAAPEILIGGGSEVAFERAAREGDGFISTPNMPDAIKEQFDAVEAAWKRRGRSGTPRFVGGMYFALGDGALERGQAYARHYYEFAGSQLQEIVAGSILSSPDAIKGTIQALEGIGMEEVIMWPTVSDLDQVDRLADVIS